MKDIIKKISILFIMIAAFILFSGQARADEPLIIVIDPGHGGDNLGAEYRDYTEKELTMAVAKAMKEELEKYDQVIVYLTHDADVNISLEERALFAKDKNADFLFCLHFNMSVNHDLFGAEVWVPAGGEYYSKGYSFAQIEMEALTDIGLYSRGIKTKLNDKGDNYYGILRHCSIQQIPSVLIEHCHLDHARDQNFYQQGEQQLKEFGRIDATAVAKYFRLSSTLLDVDYSDYPVEEVPQPQGMAAPDKTEPELCRIEVEDINKETGEVTVFMEAEDSDSYILYYNYSLDGGNTYSMPDIWPRPNVWNQSDNNHRFTVKVPFDQQITLRAGASNGFDVWAESNEIILDPIDDPERLERERLEAERLEKEKLEAERLEAERKAEEEQKKSENATDWSDASGQAETVDSNGSNSMGNHSNGNYSMENDSTKNNSMENDSSSELWTITAIILGIFLCMIFVSFFMSKMIFQLIKGNKKR